MATEVSPLSEVGRSWLSIATSPCQSLLTFERAASCERTNINIHVIGNRYMLARLRLGSGKGIASMMSIRMSNTMAPVVPHHHVSVNKSAQHQARTKIAIEWCSLPNVVLIPILRITSTP